MFCKYCGKNIPNNSEFCEHCGSNLTNGNSVSQVLDRKRDNDSGNYVAKIKKVGILFAVWIVSFGIINMLNDSYGEEFGNFIVSVALASLIIFLWNRISKKYL
jgi:uncharacterized membrane protein YvbJ